MVNLSKKWRQVCRKIFAVVMTASILITSNLGTLNLSPVQVADAAVAADGTCGVVDSSGVTVSPNTYITDATYGQYGYADDNCLFFSYDDSSVYYELDTGLKVCTWNWNDNLPVYPGDSYSDSWGTTSYDSNCGYSYTVLACTTDMNGDYIAPGGTAYWSDGSYTVYDANCSGTWTESTATASTSCGTDDYGTTVYSDSSGYSSDGSYTYGAYDAACNYTTSDTGSGGSIGSTGSTCIESTDGDLTCSTCGTLGDSDYDYSCWKNGSYEFDKCVYDKSGNIETSMCYDANGNVVSISEWEENNDTNVPTGSGVS